MKYPFEFDELRLTDKMLDLLGFSAYWSGVSEYGERTFRNGDDYYRIVDNDELDDESFGYDTPRYYAQNFSSPFKAKVSRRIYFLHDLYEDISDNAPKLLEAFIEKTKEKGINMFPFIKSYLEFKNKNVPRSTVSG